MTRRPKKNQKSQAKLQDFVVVTFAEGLEQAKDYEAKVLTCASRQRGAFRSHAVQRKKDAERMQANYVAQMGWLAENNYPLYQKLKALKPTNP